MLNVVSTLWFQLASKEEKQINNSPYSKAAKGEQLNHPKPSVSKIKAVYAKGAEEKR
jgi:hypothetical protein